MSATAEKLEDQFELEDEHKNIANSVVNSSLYRSTWRSEISYQKLDTTNQHLSYLDNKDSVQVKRISDVFVGLQKKVQLENFVALQQWEGYVTDVRDDEFTGLLVDVTMGNTETEEEVDIAYEEISNHDRNLIELGAVFTWSIGYLTQGNTKSRISRVVFTNLPAFTSREIKEASDEAISLGQSIKWI